MIIKQEQLSENNINEVFEMISLSLNYSDRDIKITDKGIRIEYKKSGAGFLLVQFGMWIALTHENNIIFSRSVTKN